MLLKEISTYSEIYKSWEKTSRYRDRYKGFGLIPWRAKDYSPLHSVKPESGAHPVSYTMGTVGSFLGFKAARA
jgi:hypothetical protein